jgi:hypothetical protein
MKLTAILFCLKLKKFVFVIKYDHEKVKAMF